MAITRIGDVVVPEVFTPYSQKLTTEKTAIIASGVVTPSALLDDKLSQGGGFFQIPTFLDLDNDEARIDTDTSLPMNQPDSLLGTDPNASGLDGYARQPDPKKIRTATEVAVRMSRNQSWGVSQLARQLAGADPMEAIAQLVSGYWARQYQRSFISTWQGVFAANDAKTTAAIAGVAQTAGDFTHDLTAGESGAAGSIMPVATNMFAASDVIDARSTMGDSSGELMTIMVHSTIYAQMQKQDLIVYIQHSITNIQIPTYLGMQVVVDDSMPNGNGKYETWIFGGDTTQYGSTLAETPTEIDRQAGSGNGGGGEILYSRSVNCFHPSGYAWGDTTALTDGGPSNSDLASPASWKQVFGERKMYKVARLITREAVNTTLVA